MKSPFVQPLFIVALVLLATAPTPAFAYLDPGTGSLILQVIIGAFVAVSVVVGSIRHKIINFFKSGGDSSDKKTNDKSES